MNIIAIFNNTRRVAKIISSKETRKAMKTKDIFTAFFHFQYQTRKSSFAATIGTFYSDLLILHRLPELSWILDENSLLYSVPGRRIN